MRLLRLVVVILLVIFLQYTFVKAEDDPIEKRLSECMKDADYTTVGMNKCTEEACKQWDAELNKYYKLLTGILNKEEKKQLKDAQIAWLEYRDLETKFRISAFLNMQGTMYTNMAMAEKLDIIKQRALELKTLYNTLKYVRDE